LKKTLIPLKKRNFVGWNWLKWLNFSYLVSGKLRDSIIRILKIYLKALFF